MHAPNEVLDLLETILGIFFYDIRYKERSVFILCDNLVELSCKIKIKQVNHKEDVKKMSFYLALTKVKIGEKLRDRLLIRRDIRGDMQHQIAGITIDKQQCADAIIELVLLIQHRNLWGKYAFDPAPAWMLCGLRIVKLYSRLGEIKKRKNLEETLKSKINWNEEEFGNDSKILSKLEKEESGFELVKLDGSPAGARRPDSHEIIIPIGSSEHWTYLLKEYTEKVSTCLDDLEVEEV